MDLHIALLRELDGGHLVMPEPGIGELEVDGAALVLEFCVALDERLKESEM